MNSFGKTLTLIAGLILSSTVMTATAQGVDSTSTSTSRSIVESVRSAHQRLDYEKAESLGLSALAQFQRFDADQLIEINVTLALIYYSRNDTEDSRRFFLSALSLDPALEMDPLLVSPKILSFFREVKSESVNDRTVEANAESTFIRYLVLQDTRPEAALRSMIAPGWGQIGLGKSSKGRILIAAWTAAAAGTILSYFKTRDARSDYLHETDPVLVEDRFDQFNKWHKTRNSFALAAAAVWTFSLVDILMSRPTEPSRKVALPLDFRAGPGSLALQIRF